jgi:hypothetical protein
MGVNMTSVMSRKGLKIQSRRCAPIAGLYFSRAPAPRSTATDHEPLKGRSMKV